MKRRKLIKRVLYITGAVVIAYAAWNLWQIQRSTEEATGLYDELAQKAGHNAESAPDGGKQAAAAGATGRAAVEEAQGQAEEEAQGQAEEEASYERNDWLTDLQELNGDLVAWIKIPDTNIDYPVMQTKEDNDYYLDHDFEGNELRHGTPYLDFYCDLDKSENLIIYGHNMKDGTMFQNLMRYREADYCESNGTITLFTPANTREYQVQMVMVISAEEAEEFPYYTYIDLSEEGVYGEYFDKCREYSIWESEEGAESGTPLLTLSTCEYTKGDGRLVVIARETDVE